MDRAWAEKNSETALRFMRAFKESNEFIKTNPKEAAQITSKVLKIEQPVVERLMVVAKCEYVLLLKQDAMVYLKSDVENLIETNRIKGPFDYKGYVYPDLLRKLDPSLVNYKLPE
jgi:ABC-type nitrate/sulfonate/bicarbonate transport system substrate-binding protein